MRLEQLAARAGEAAADVGREAKRPELSRMLAAQRRRNTVSSLSVIAGIGAIVLLVGVLSSRYYDARLVAPPASEPSASLEGVPASCPVTVVGPNSFNPASERPEGPPSVYERVWYGTADLWTMISPEGEVWRRLPVRADGTIVNRTFWWSLNYSSDDPGEITVTAELLGSGSTVEFSSEAGTGFNPFMLAPTHESVTMIGVGLPGPGCWRLSALYKGAALSYVV